MQSWVSFLTMLINVSRDWEGCMGYVRPSCTRVNRIASILLKAAHAERHGLIYLGLHIGNLSHCAWGLSRQAKQDIRVLALMRQLQQVPPHLRELGMETSCIPRGTQAGSAVTCAEKDKRSLVTWLSSPSKPVVQEGKCFVKHSSPPDAKDQRGETSAVRDK